LHAPETPTSPNTKIISLTQGKVTLVDDWNFEWLNQFKWYALHNHGHWYAVRRLRRVNGKQDAQYMHRFIMGVTDSKIQVDHKDRNATLDNREENLRIATHAQNQRNVGPNVRNRSGFKGVSWDKAAGKWRTRIQFNGKQIHLGLFNSLLSKLGFERRG